MEELLRDLPSIELGSKIITIKRKEYDEKIEETEEFRKDEEKIEYEIEESKTGLFINGKNGKLTGKFISLDGKFDSKLEMWIFPKNKREQLEILKKEGKLGRFKVKFDILSDKILNNSVKERITYEWYNFFREQIFTGLPKSFPFVFNNIPCKRAGCFKYYTHEKPQNKKNTYIVKKSDSNTFYELSDFSISLSMKVLKTEAQLVATLAHELCHAADKIIDGHIENDNESCHGEHFWKWANIVNKKFPHIVITQFHDYHLDRYNYHCPTCYEYFSYLRKVKHCRYDGSPLKFLGIS